MRDKKKYVEIWTDIGGLLFEIGAAIGYSVFLFLIISLVLR